MFSVSGLGLPPNGLSEFKKLSMFVAAFSAGISGVVDCFCSSIGKIGFGLGTWRAFKNFGPASKFGHFFRFLE